MRGGGQGTCVPQLTYGGQGTTWGQFFPFTGSWEVNSGCQVWWQTVYLLSYVTWSEASCISSAQQTWSYGYKATLAFYVSCIYNSRTFASMKLHYASVYLSIQSWRPSGGERRKVSEQWSAHLFHCLLTIWHLTALELLDMLLYTYCQLLIFPPPH